MATKQITVELQRPHAGQEAIGELFDKNGVRFAAVMCARQFGKTSDLVRRACVAALAGQQVGIFVPQLVYASEIWREITQALGQTIAKKNEQQRRLEVIVEGGVIEVWSFDSNEDAGRGRRYDWIFVDEAGLIGDLRSKWNLALRATLIAKKGRAVLYGTPKGAKSDFVTLFREAEGGTLPGWAGLRRKTVDNPYIDPEEVERARAEMSPEQFAQEYEAVPMDDGANPFGLETIKAAIAERSTERVEVWGIDLARSQDWCWMIGLDRWGRWCRSERWQAPWSVSKKRIADTLKREGGLAVVDSTGVGDAIVDDLIYQGVDRIERYVFSETKKRHLIEGIISALHGKRHTIPGNEHQGQLKRELESMGVEWRNGKPYYECPRSMHDDGIMALGMAIWGYTQSVPAPDWPLAPSERVPWTPGVDATRFSPVEVSPSEYAEWGGLGSGW